MSKEELAPSRTAEQFVVRFPDGMRDRIAESAKAAGRSMNSEIVSCLQAKYSDRDAPRFSRARSDSSSEDSLFQLIDAQRKTIKSQEVAIDTLRTYLVEVINSLPPELQSEEKIALAAKIAAG